MEFALIEPEFFVRKIPSSNHYFVNTPYWQALFYYFNVYLATATAWFNNEAYHSPAVAINTLSNVLLAYYTNNKNLKITAVNNPLPTTAKDSAQDLST